MLTSSTHGVKAALLRSYKEGGRRVAEPNSSSHDGYLLYYYSSLVPSTDPTRAITKIHSYLMEGDVRQMWQHAKQRLKGRLRDAHSVYKQPQQQGQPGSTVARATAAELENLYGKNGAFRTAVMYILAHASRGFMTHLNNTTVEGVQHMEAALARAPGTPLITVSNHVASMDDPLVMSAILPPQVYSDPTQLRWTLCASDRCFHRQALVPFFRAAKVLPVERGAGMFQQGLAAAEARLAAGDWVHIFPEGTRSRDGKMGPVRKGVGRLVASCADAQPLIVPFVHTGMEEVLPKGALLPKANKEVKVLVGEPIDVSDLLQAASKHSWADDKLYSSIANRIGSHMAALKAQLDGVPLDAAQQQQQQQAALDAGLDLYDPLDNAHRAASLWERMAFRTQHREWAYHGLASAKAKLAAAAARSLTAVGLSGEADAAAAAAAAGDEAAGPVTAAVSRWRELQQRRQHLQQRPLAWVKECLLQSGGDESEYMSRQRSIAMMQLLQARV